MRLKQRPDYDALLVTLECMKSIIDATILKIQDAKQLPVRRDAGHSDYVAFCDVYYELLKLPVSMSNLCAILETIEKAKVTK